MEVAGVDGRRAKLMTATPQTQVWLQGPIYGSVLDNKSKPSSVRAWTELKMF